MMDIAIKISGADLSADGKYRYSLWRIWHNKLPLAMCIGLNPSKANSIKNDATINNLIGMLHKLGYGGFYMMNLFAWISPHPEDLLICADPLGDNDGKLELANAICDDVIFCWGRFPQAVERSKQIIPQYPSAKCFGKNKNGSPYHPRALTYIKGALDSPQLISY